ncbi:MAG: serine/threonine-protein phosphatase, partial [Spirochaetales bacterium]|nr:serine/threonine-protein phosphatase [Spirochaetales bacterium]
SQMYDIINRILCTINRDRIGSDKFMTGNVFVEKNGVVHHAGTHEIALLFKKDTGNVVEIRETTDKTAFLGLSELVVSTQSEGSFSMNEGDILLLYTDGAIEAKNDTGDQYGVERLARELKDHAELPLSQLIQTLETDIRRFAKNGDMRRYDGNMADDVTFVCLRRQ